MTVRLQYEVTDHHLTSLINLFSSAWWMSGRTLEETKTILRESDLVLALIDSSLVS